MTDVVLAGAVRTPIGTMGGGLASVTAPDLGAVVIGEALRRAGVAPDVVDDVIFGCVLSAGAGMNPARQAAIAAGIGEMVPAVTVNRVCGSGLEAVVRAAQAIRAGDAEVVVAGGTESMSSAPFLLPKARFGYRLGHGEVVDHVIRDGLWCAMSDCHMGITAENVVERYEIPRKDQDAFAATSQERAAAAIEAGRFRDEIVPVPVPGKKGVVSFEVDEHPRAGTTTEALAKLRPAFRDGGSVTAGNASGINDGAAAVVVLSRERAEALGVRPMARIMASAVAGVEPKVMGLGPIPATRKALERAGRSIGDLDLVEANEAFAAQSIAVVRELGFDPERVNVNGGAIALGHPIGASGARILVTLLHEMSRRNVRTGLATLCIGGGQGIASVVERLEG